MTDEQSQALIDVVSEGEGVELEFKSAAGGLPKDMWRTVSAFANTLGGRIVLGVKEIDGTLMIEGVPHHDQRIRDFLTASRSSDKISCTTLFGPGDVQTIPFDGKSLVVIHVPEAGRSQRPVYIGKAMEHGTYIRLHEGDHQCGTDELRRLLRESAEQPGDGAILPDFTLDDIDAETLRGYRQRFLNRDAAHPWNVLGDHDFLRNVQAIKYDRYRRVEGLTLAGLLFFGKRIAILEHRPYHAIDFRILRKIAAPEDWRDREFLQENLLTAFDRIIGKLNSVLIVPFALDGPYRIQETTRHQAVREAFVNLLAHADYSESASSLVLCSEEGFLFRNPGNSRVPQQQLLSQARSDPRNPAILDLFRYIGLAERSGRGVSEIVGSWKSEGLRPPVILAGSSVRYEFSLSFSLAHLLDDRDSAWLSALGDNIDIPERLALVLARDEGQVDNARLRDTSGQHPTDASRSLTRLRNQGLLEMFGVKRGAWYALSSAAMRVWAGISLGMSADPTGSVATPSQIQTQVGFTQGQAGSAQGQASSTQGQADSAQGQADDSHRPQLDGITFDEQQIIAVQEQFNVDGDLDRALVALCTVQPQTARTLAHLLDRRPSGHIRRRLRSLVTDGKLVLTNPGKPRDPGQRYRAVVTPAHRTRP